jgi:hypothetical protein
VYRVNPGTGSLQILHQFGGTSDVDKSDGVGPRGRLVEVPPLPGHDIAFVGVTQTGRIYGNGVVYRVDVVNGTRS